MIKVLLEKIHWELLFVTSVLMKSMERWNWAWEEVRVDHRCDRKVGVKSMVGGVKVKKAKKVL